MAKVYCNGEEVLTTSGTQSSYTVDIWSGNHPFFKGSSSSVVIDEGRVNRFKRRYDGLTAMTDMSTMKGAICLPTRSVRSRAKEAKQRMSKSRSPRLMQDAEATERAWTDLIMAHQCGVCCEILHASVRHPMLPARCACHVG